MSAFHISPQEVVVECSERERSSAAFVAEIMAPGTTSSARFEADGTIHSQIAPDVLMGDLARKFLERAHVDYDISI